MMRVLPRLALLQPAPIRKRLWQGAIVLAMFLLTLVIGNFVSAPEKSVRSQMLGHDFLAFYAAGTFVRTGDAALLYNLDAIRTSERAISASAGLDAGKNWGPYWNPPFYAWIFAPLSALPYRWALLTWTCINLTCLILAMRLLMKMLPADVVKQPRLAGYIEDSLSLHFRRDWKNTALVPLLILISMPFIQAIGHGQNTFTSLLLLAIVVTAWRKDMPLLAGSVCGLMFYKPQLAAVIATMLFLTLGLRVIIGLGAVGCVLSLITVFTLPGTLESYITQLPANLAYMQVDHAYLWERHVTLKAFWRLLFQGRDAGEANWIVQSLTLASCATIGFGLLSAWWRTRAPGMDDCFTGETRRVARDRLIGATICAMPLLMPFYFDYDLLLLSVPATLLGAELTSRAPGAKLDSRLRMLIASWVGLFLWLAVNPPLAGMSGVNVTVVLLSSVSALSILHAMHRGVRTEDACIPLTIQIHPLRKAA